MVGTYRLEQLNHGRTSDKLSYTAHSRWQKGILSCNVTSSFWCHLSFVNQHIPWKGEQVQLFILKDKSKIHHLCLCGWPTHIYIYMYIIIYYILNSLWECICDASATSNANWEGEYILLQKLMGMHILTLYSFHSFLSNIDMQFKSLNFHIPLHANLWLLLFHVNIFFCKVIISLKVLAVKVLNNLPSRRQKFASLSLFSLSKRG